MKLQDIIQKCRDNRDDKGVAWIASKEVAVLVRAQIRRHFAGVKFSVRSDYNSVNTYWTDGPCEFQVDQVVCQYRFGGFDGMIDLAYSADNWLLPDGTMSAGSSEGTQGSHGVYESYATDCPQPGAVIVRGGPKYVFTQRHISPERLRVLVDRVAERYDVEVDHDLPYHSQHIYDGKGYGDYLNIAAFQLEIKEAKEAEEREEAPQ